MMVATAPRLLSPIAAGLWRLPAWGLSTQALVRWIEDALALGITSFDHADIYGDYSVEAQFGQALDAAPGLRRRLQVVTKCGIKVVSPARPQHGVKTYDSSRAHVLASVDASLRALRCDHLDLLLLHRPDLLMDPDELAGTFADLKAAGKVLAVGVSNHSTGQVAVLHKRHALAAQQMELSLLHMHALADGTLEQCLDLGLVPMVWSPLGGGRLFSSDDVQAVRLRAVLEQLGRSHGVAPATVAYAWIMRHPARPVPVTGSGRIAALREAVAALSLQLPAEDWYRLWQASMGQEVP